jgi:hypothetical protein
VIAWTCLGWSRCPWLCKLDSALAYSWRRDGDAAAGF